MQEKLQLVRDRRYVVGGSVESLTSFFAVPKGDDDIRMVYDGTKSGLNASIWVPRFPLPTVNTMLRAVTFGTVMSDFDIGDCFLNFILHETLQALCGIDLTEFFGDGKHSMGALGPRSYGVEKLSLPSGPGYYGGKGGCDG